MEGKPDQSRHQQQFLNHEGLQHHSLHCSGLEVIPNDRRLGLQTPSSDGDKEAFATDISQLEVRWQTLETEFPQLEVQSQTSATGKLRVSRRFPRRRLFIIVLAIIATCFIVIVVAVLETRKHRPKANSLVSPSPSPSGASTASSSPTSPALPVATPLNLDSGLDLATAGALNGTSLLALLPTDQTDWVLLFFQHESAGLKYARKSSDNTWQAGEAIGGVPEAINKTPLAGVSYLTEPKASYATWQLYYIDLSGTLQNIYDVDATNNWTTGSLGSHSFHAFQSPGAALAADASSWYGSKPNVGLGGVRLLAAGNDSLVHEYIYTIESDTWEAGFTFPNSNGNAGVSITHYSALSEVVLTNSQGQLEYWWRDDNISKVNSSSYYFGIWNKGTTSVTALHQNSAICTSNLTYIQDPDNSILTVDRQDANKHARWGPTTNVSSSDVGAVLSGSSLACNTQESKHSLHMFYAYFQTEGGHVVEYGKGLTDAAWTLDHTPS